MCGGGGGGGGVLGWGMLLCGVHHMDIHMDKNLTFNMHVMHNNCKIYIIIQILNC